MSQVTETSFTNLDDLTQEEKRKIVLDRKGWTVSYLAKCLGISKVTLGHHLRSATMLVDYHTVLVEKGFPADCLPRPEDKKRGPKPKIPLEAEPPQITPEAQPPKIHSGA